MGRVLGRGPTPPSPYHDVVSIFGASNAITNSQRTVWPDESRYSFLSSAQTLTVESDSALDTAAGTGAQSVFIVGLDDDFRYIEELVILDGTTPVATSIPFLRVNSAIVAQAGTVDTNAGTITISSPGETVAVIPQDMGITRQSVYTIPEGRNADLLHVSLNVAANSADVYFFMHPRGGASSRVFELFGVGSAGFNRTFPQGARIGEGPIDMWIDAERGGGSDASLSATFDIGIL